MRVYLDPLARASYSKAHQTYTFGNVKSSPRKRKSAPEPLKTLPVSRTLSKTQSHSSLVHLEVMLREMGETQRSAFDQGIGVDAQSVSEIEARLTSSAEFTTRNFTPSEIKYCQLSADTTTSFAGRWAAKEAVVKAMSSCDEKAKSMWLGGGAPLIDIEILPGASGAPVVHLHGHAKAVAQALNVTKVKVSISHSGEYAVAQASAR
mmetsp:Transcript_15133/g.16835  ORF Transcript_15133/g.16835 Transcript_15133/m.16835 type:complete len:206 (+) Transcript_15133:2-619(+)